MATEKFLKKIPWAMRLSAVAVLAFVICLSLGFIWWSLFSGIFSVILFISHICTLKL